MTTPKVVTPASEDVIDLNFIETLLVEQAPQTIAEEMAQHDGNQKCREAIRKLNISKQNT